MATKKSDENSDSKKKPKTTKKSSQIEIVPHPLNADNFLNNMKPRNAEANEANDIEKASKGTTLKESLNSYADDTLNNKPSMFEAGLQEEKQEDDITEEGIPFEVVFNRLVDAKIIETKTQLSKILKISRAAVSYISEKRKFIPHEWQRRFEDAGYNWEWVTTGEGNIYNSKSMFSKGAVIGSHELRYTPERGVYLDIKSNEIPISRNEVDYDIKEGKLGYIKTTENELGGVLFNQAIGIISLNEKDIEIKGRKSYACIVKDSLLILRTDITQDGIVFQYFKSLSADPVVFTADQIRVVGVVIAKFAKA